MRCRTWARMPPRPGRLWRLPSPVRLVRLIASLRLPPCLRRSERQAGKVRTPERLGAALALLGRQDPFWVRLAVELGEERGSGLRGGLPPVALAVQRMSSQPRPEASFSRTYRLVPWHRYLAISSDQQGPFQHLCGHH